ncbi:MAG: KH domain-containing protein [Candidatus Saccharimonadales bacterium]
MTNTKLEGSAGELIKLIACALVDKPDNVSVKVISREADTLIELRVDPAEVGRIIGKQGRTARSLRTILSAVSIKLGHRYSLEIVEEIEAPDHSGIR